MNAVMTWWAISLTLLTHDFGNEVLSREQLLRWVPFFVATLVWLTRILFIGAISVAGEYMFATPLLQREASSKPAVNQKRKQPARRKPAAKRPYQPKVAPVQAKPQSGNGRRPTPVRRRGKQAPGRSGRRP